MDISKLNQIAVQYIVEQIVLVRFYFLFVEVLNVLAKVMFQSLALLSLGLENPKRSHSTRGFGLCNCTLRLCLLGLALIFLLD